MQGPGDLPVHEYLINIGVALLGASVRFARQWQVNFARWDAKRVWLEAFINAATAGFVGVLTYWALRSVNTDPLYTAFAVGIMGHMGAEALQLFWELASNGLRSRAAPPKG